MKNDRSPKPRGKKPGAAPARGGPRKPPRAYGDAPPPRRAPARPPRERAAPNDPYKPARAPARDFTRSDDAGSRSGTERPRLKPRGSFAERGSFGDRGGFGDRGNFAERKRFGARDERASHGDRPARGFTVTLDPDVARVFRGDASVNKALRLVLQMMQVVQGPPARPDRPRGYQGSAEARGFERKPRFADDEGGEGGEGELPLGDSDAAAGDDAGEDEGAA